MFDTPYQRRHLESREKPALRQRRRPAAPASCFTADVTASARSLAALDLQPV